jgi:hypothetical protein
VPGVFIQADEREYAANVQDTFNPFTGNGLAAAFAAGGAA